MRLLRSGWLGLGLASLLPLSCRPDPVNVGVANVDPGPHGDSGVVVGDTGLGHGDADDPGDDRGDDAGDATATDPSVPDDGPGDPGPCPVDTFGPACDACPDCGSHGACNDGRDGDGTCDCDSGWEGAACDTCPACPPHLRIDFGSAADGFFTTDAGWNNYTDACETVGSTLADLVDTSGAGTTVTVETLVAFGGINEAGMATNDLGYPVTVGNDSCFCGSFTDHADGLLYPAEIALHQVPAASYRLRLFASREGTGADRLTRYTVGSIWQELQVTDNTGDVAELSDVAPNTAGSIVIHVEVSPDGTGQFCYLGALELIPN